MSTKLQYPINQLRDSPVRPPKNAKGSKLSSAAQASTYYPEINNQRPTYPEETQVRGVFKEKFIETLILEFFSFFVLFFPPYDRFYPRVMVTVVFQEKIENID